MKKFNTTGLCVPQEHYMVDMSGRIAQIRAMVDKGDYFCINRARQYGKTTLLAALARALSGVYDVASIDFQVLSRSSFESEGAFAKEFCELLFEAHDVGDLVLSESTIDMLRRLCERDSSEITLPALFRTLRTWIHDSPRPIVLIVDEVDSATNNQVFLDFLAQLRFQYLSRARSPTYPAFQSVILAGVTDVKHLKARIRPDDESKMNSPWNIAADFRVRMSFDAHDVAGMLAQYESEHATGMDVDAIAREIVAWTGGYPFLTSRLCELIAEHGLGWDRTGVDAGAKAMVAERNTLFESLSGKLEAHPKLKDILRRVLMRGERLPNATLQDDIAQLEMYGFVTRRPSGEVTIANRIFETLLYDLFILEDKIAGSDVYEKGELGRSRFVRGGRLDMCEVLEGFRHAFTEVFGPLQDRFPEKDGRELFLLYLKPIINGTGNYYIEAQTRDHARMDVVVDYLGERFVVELKIWRGRRYNEEGEEQLKGYLDYFGLDVGYMLSFSFNKHKEPGLKRVEMDGRVIWEETV